jgi:DNA polymerase III alpha subunit
VLVRQRPSTAGGIVFMTLEDETGIANLVLKPKIYRRHRPIARHAVAMVAFGRVERRGEVVHLVVGRVESIAGSSRASERATSVSVPSFPEGVLDRSTQDDPASRRPVDERFSPSRIEPETAIRTSTSIRAEMAAQRDSTHADPHSASLGVHTSTSEPAWRIRSRSFH